MSWCFLCAGSMLITGSQIAYEIGQWGFATCVEQARKSDLNVHPAASLVPKCRFSAHPPDFLKPSVMPLRQHKSRSNQGLMCCYSS